MVTLEVVESKEAYVTDRYPDTNYEGESRVQVSAVPYIYRSLMEFSLTSLIDVPIDNISSATLVMYLNTTTDPRTIDVQRIDNGTWVDSTVTWNTQPTSSDYNIEVDWSGSGLKYVTVTSLLKDALRNGHDYLGILLKYLDETGDASNHLSLFSWVWFLSIEYDIYSQTALHNCLCQNRHFIDGWGEITMTDHNCAESGPCDAATFTFKTAWGTTYTPVLLDVGDTVQYDSGIMHHSFKLDSIISYSPTCCDTLTSATIEEKYWEDDCYVKTTGDNDRNGTDWTEAWSTVDQAANEAFDGQEVHIGFGTYSSEPANNDITPVNFGTTGIKYTPETAVTGGGTGAVTVERN